MQIKNRNIEYVSTGLEGLWSERLYNMLQIIVKLIGVIIILVGVVFIYDARILTKKLFGFGDQNEATSGFKILGAMLSIVGGLIVYFDI